MHCTAHPGTLGCRTTAEKLIMTGASLNYDDNWLYNVATRGHATRWPGAAHARLHLTPSSRDGRQKSTCHDPAAERRVCIGAKLLNQILFHVLQGTGHPGVVLLPRLNASTGS